MTPRRAAPLRRALALAFGLAAATAGSARAEAPGDVERSPAVAASGAAPLRQALIVAPPASAPGPFGGDAAATRDLLRLVGFDVTMVSSDTRPALDAAARDFADAVKPGAEVALFLLGAARAGGGALFVVPPGAAPSPGRPAADFDGVRLARLLRSIARQGPKSVVTVVDGCAPDGDARACPAGADVVPEGDGALLASPSRPPSGATLREPLLGLMKREGLVFADLAEPLRRAAEAAGLGFAATPALSRSFAFLPVDFFARLPRACSGVDPRLGVGALRAGPDLGPAVADCEAAAVTYAAWPFFRDRLAAAREQRAARAALLSCDGAAAAAYLDSYPAGLYRTDVARQRQNCVPPPSPLEQRATDAVADFYRRHNYRDGDSFVGIAELYPPKFNNRGRTTTVVEYLGQLGTMYAGLNSLRLDPDRDSFDFSDCVRPDACRVRGRMRSQTLKRGQSEYAYTDWRFSLKFNLDTAKVLYECAVIDPPNPREQACE